ncbi:MAG: hypothetical protein K2M30_02130 [Desulfovibrionaceae bacterium]|nr:hypothetical protein [Desulfovibrionaceae bacterium]
MKSGHDTVQAYIRLQEILESNESLPITQGIVQSIECVLHTWDTAYADALLIQCGKGIFFNTVARFLPHLSLVEPCAETYIELQRQYLHLSLYGNHLYHINADAKSFDYTIMIYPALYLHSADIQEVLREVLRVTSRSVFLLFFNSCSLEYCLHKIYRRHEYTNSVWYTASRLQSCVHRIQRQAVCSFSSLGVLPFSQTVKKKKRYRIVPYPCGTLGSMCIHIPQNTLLTPIVTPLRRHTKGQLRWGGASSRSLPE